MKREMKSNLFKIVILCITVIFFTSCSFLQKKEENIATPEEVYTAIFLDDSYSLNKYLSEGFPIEYRDSSDKTLLMTVLENNSLKSLDILLTRRVDTEARDSNGRTAIFYIRSLEALKSMVENGANLDVVSLKNKTSLLTYFIKEKSVLHTQYLIESGADFNLKDSEGWDSVFWSAVVGEKEVIRKLKDAGANFLEIDMKGNYPIYYAYDESSILELLEVSGYNLKLKNLQGENILGEVYLRAVANGYTEVITKLLDLGVNPRYTSYGESAMSIAKKINNPDMIKFLNDNNIK